MSIKNLTTEVAEHTEIKTVKGSRPRVQGNKQPPFQPFPEGQPCQGAFKKRSLRSLLPLRSSSCLHPWRIQRKKDFYSPKEKRTTNRRDPGGRRGFYNFLCNKKMSRQEKNGFFITVKFQKSRVQGRFENRPLHLKSESPLSGKRNHFFS